MDVVIPLVFPDYRVAVEVRKSEVDVFPWTNIDNFSTPTFKQRMSNLGHAGVLFVNGESGETKYYEYGRYDQPHELGIVLKAKNLPNAKVADGKVSPASLKPALAYISRASGQSGRIKGVYVEVEGKYDLMLGLAELRRSQNAVRSRRPYSLVSNSCIHFVKDITDRASIRSPWMIDPRPNSYIGEFRDDFPDLDFESGTLIIEDIGKF